MPGKLHAIGKPRFNRLGSATINQFNGRAGFAADTRAFFKHGRFRIREGNG